MTKKVNGDLRSKMGSLTHKNLPLAIFLEEADLGYPAWSGSTNSKVSNDQIISSLGIGVVRFNGELEPPDVNDFDYEYRVDTDVISSVEVSGGQSDPDNPVTVRFVIQGRTYTCQQCLLSGRRQSIGMGEVAHAVRAMRHYDCRQRVWRRHGAEHDHL